MITFVALQCNQTSQADRPGRRYLQPKMDWGGVRTGAAISRSYQEGPRSETRFSASASSLWAPDQGPCPRKCAYHTRRRPLITQGMGPCSRSRETMVPRSPVLIFSAKRTQLHVACLGQVNRTGQQIILYLKPNSMKVQARAFGVGRTRRPPGCTSLSCLAVRDSLFLCFLIWQTGVIPSSLVCYEN